MTYRVVVTDHTFDSLDVEREVLEAVEDGVELVDAQEQEKDVRDLVGDADAVIIMYANVDADLLDAMPDCRVVSRMGIGLDNVDVAAATERGVRVTNVPDYCIDEVSTHTIALMLALQRNVVFYDRQTDDGGWDVAAGPPMHRISEQTLGLVALGKTATEVARKGSGLGMEVLAWDPYLDDEAIRERGASPVDELDELLTRCDVLSVHTPLTDETEGLIGPTEFERLDEDAIVLNVARGGIVDEPALAGALDDGEIAGAGVDVLTEEPPEESHPLVGRDDVLLTPHAAWNSVESTMELRRKAAENVRAVFEGRVPPYLVNDEVTD